jgi:hypothetical protein
VDEALLDAARKQLHSVVADADYMGFLGWWMAWKEQDGVTHDELVDLINEAGVPWPAP